MWLEVRRSRTYIAKQIEEIMNKPDDEKVVMTPIGLKPKFANRLERLSEVRSAIVRYYDAELKIPVEWIEEYNELIDSTKV